VVLKVQPPTDAELEQFKPARFLVSFQPPSLKEKLAAKKVNAMAMERVPRTTGPGGRRAVVAGDGRRVQGGASGGRSHAASVAMMTTAGGTLTPGKALILGRAWRVAAIANCASARGASRPSTCAAAVKSRIQSLGPKFIEIEGVSNAEEPGGYAKEVGQDDQAAILSTGQACSPGGPRHHHAQIPNKPARRLITKDMVWAMRHGSVIRGPRCRDGRNCELTKCR